MNVITNGSVGTPVADVPTEVIFAPTTLTISVSSGSKLQVDANDIALESDIDSSLSVYVAMTGTGSDGSVGTSSFKAITSITTSTKLKKGGTVVVLKSTINFDMAVDAVWVILSGPTNSTKYTPGYLISCTLSWTSVQTKLSA